MAGYATLLNSGSPWQSNAGVAVANTASETALTPLPNYNFPANFLTMGNVLRCKASGTVSTTGTPNMTLALKWGGVGGVVLCQWGLSAMNSAESNVPWNLEIMSNVRLAAGGTQPQSTIFSSGTMWGFTTNTAMLQIPNQTGPGTLATVDLTVAKDLAITVLWGTASASNTITCNQWFIELLNQQT